MEGTHYRSDPWWKAARERTVLEVAAALGLEHDAKSCACPACGATRRGSSDRRLVLLLTPNRMGWCCPRCDASGSALDLAYWKLTGRAWRAGDREASALLQAWCASRGWCEAEADGAAPRRRVRLVKPRSAPPERATSPEPAHPPRGEVEALWAACGPLDTTGADLDPLDLELSLWLSCDRALYPPAVAELDLARVLPAPAGHRFPRWVPSSWWPRYRLALPAWTAAGELGSLRLRCPGDPSGRGPKEMAPYGVSAKGLTLADPVGLSLLRGEPDPRWDGSVLVAEGCPDFLTWAIRPWADKQPAIFGTWSGAWTADLASRIPDGARVILATDANDPGDRMALAIQATLHPRCACGRMKARPA
jgi:hypothetical protein